MKVDIRVPVGLPIQETADFIAGCEAAGFSGVGVHDHQHSGRDVFITLALAAERTSRLTLYPATSNPVTRHSMVLASLAHSLEEIAPERVRLTVGPGYLSVGNIGRPRATVAAMREAVFTIRRLLRGEQVEFNGVATRLRNLSAWPTPVFMTAAGPRMVELAGEVADGALLLVGLHPKRSTRLAADWKSEQHERDAASTVSRRSSSPQRRCRMMAQPRVAFPNNGSGPISHT